MILKIFLVKVLIEPNTQERINIGNKILSN